MISFKQFLSERAQRPHHLSAIKYNIDRLKGKLWEKGLQLDEIIEHLENELGRYLIRFEETYADGESEYSAVGLGGGQMTANGWVVINYRRDLDDVLNGDGTMYYEDFSRLLVALIGHELAHREQLLKSTKNFDNIPETDDTIKYLSDHREIEAYAIQACLELLEQLSKEEILEKLKSERGQSHLALFSEGLKWYVRTFDSGDPVLKKFLKKVFEILEDDE